MKDIVIISNFCRDFSVNDNGRFMYLCKELSKKHKVEILTSDFDHTAKEKKSPLKVMWPFQITFIEELGYKKNISIRRFFSHYIWGINVYKYMQNRKKPDVIYCAMPSLTAAAKVSSYCKKNDIKFIIDIQDLWPEAFQMVLNIPIVSDFLFLPFKIIANKAYKNADVICGVSETYVNRALSVNDKKPQTNIAFLGTKLSTFDENTSCIPFIKKDINASDEFWIGYCGTLSDSYDIKMVVDALFSLKNTTPRNCKFIIIGGGYMKEEFEGYSKSKGIDAIFTGKLDYSQMCATLVQCDIVVNPIVKGSAASIINKHGDYAASGLPVLNTQESMEYRKLVETYNMGFNCTNGDSEELAERILLLIQNEELRKEMGKNARRCAEEMFDRKNSYLKLITAIES